MQAAALSRRQREVQGLKPVAAAAVIYVRANPGRDIMLKGAGLSGNLQALALERADKKSVERALKLYESKEYSVAEITELTGVSKATLYRRLKEHSA